MVFGKDLLAYVEEDQDMINLGPVLLWVKSQAAVYFP
jgi:hypothetical protein